MNTEAATREQYLRSAGQTSLHACPTALADAVNRRAAQLVGSLRATALRSPACLVHIFVNTVTHKDDLNREMRWHGLRDREEAMPCRSPFQIELSLEEKVALESMARRYTSSYYSVVRAKVILLAAQGMDNGEVARRLELPRQIGSK